MSRPKGSKNKKTKDFEIINDFRAANNISISDNVMANGIIEAPQSSKTAVIKSSLKTMGRTYTAEGQTVQEAITNLKPQIARGVGVLTISNGKVSKEKIILPKQVNQIFGQVGKLMKEVALKNLLLRIGDVS